MRLRLIFQFAYVQDCISEIDGNLRNNSSNRYSPDNVLARAPPNGLPQSVTSLLFPYLSVTTVFPLRLFLVLLIFLTRLISYLW